MQTHAASEVSKRSIICRVLFKQKCLDDIRSIWNLVEEVKPTNCNPTVWSNKEKESVNSFDDMIADMESNEKLSPVVTELLLRARKLNISFVFISQSYFEVPKMVGLNATHYFIMEIPNKRELQIFHLALILKISWKFINTIFIISE